MNISPSFCTDAYCNNETNIAQILFRCTTLEFSPGTTSFSMFYYLSYFKVLFRPYRESHSGGLMTIYITVEPVLRSHCIVRPPPRRLERPHFKHLSLSITGKHLLCKVITFAMPFSYTKGDPTKQVLMYHCLHKWLPKERSL